MIPLPIECIARDSLREGVEAPLSPVSRDDELGPPTLDQFERALGMLITHTDADRKRKQDALTWARIIKGDG